MFMQLLKPLGYTYWPLTIISRSIKFVKEDILSRLPPPLALIMFLRQWKHWSMHQQRDHLCHPQMFAFLHKQMPLISLKWQNASPYSERISHFLNTKDTNQASDKNREKRQKRRRRTKTREEREERERREREPYNNLVWNSQLEELTVDKNQLIEGSCYTTAPN